MQNQDNLGSSFVSERSARGSSTTTVYYVPNAWHRNEVPGISEKSIVEIYGSFTMPPWKVKVKCEYCPTKRQWFFKLDRACDREIRFKFRINGRYDDTSALYFQCTDDQGNYNNILSPWDEVIDQSFSRKFSGFDQLEMVRSRIYLAMKHFIKLSEGTCNGT